MLRLARVAAVHPEDHSVDLVMVDDGSRLAGAQVLTQSASSNSGTHDMPTPSTPPSGDKWSLTESTDCDMIAVVAMVGRLPLVVGFLYPQVSQMLFKDPNRRVMRHASDVYTSIDGQGNSELCHPSGFFIRIGTTPAHEDLSGTDVDGKWAISKNTGNQVHLHLELPGKWSIDIEPGSGNVVMDTQGTVNLTAVGQVTVEAPQVTLDTPETLLTGHLTVQGGMNVSGTSGGATATVSGNMAIVGSSLTHNGKNVGSTHTHQGVQTGSGTTGVPT